MQNTPVVPKYSRATFAQNKKFYTQNVLLGLFSCDATSPYKKLVKKLGKRTFPRMRSMSQFFLQFKAEATGVVLAVSFFWCGE